MYQASLLLLQLRQSAKLEVELIEEGQKLLDCPTTNAIIEIAGRIASELKLDLSNLARLRVIDCYTDDGQPVTFWELYSLCFFFTKAEVMNPAVFAVVMALYCEEDIFFNEIKDWIDESDEYTHRFHESRQELLSRCFTLAVIEQKNLADRFKQLLEWWRRVYPHFPGLGFIDSLIAILFRARLNDLLDTSPLSSLAKEATTSSRRPELQYIQ